MIKTKTLYWLLLLFLKFLCTMYFFYYSYVQCIYTMFYTWLTVFMFCYPIHINVSQVGKNPLGPDSVGNLLSGVYDNKHHPLVLLDTTVSTRNVITCWQPLHAVQYFMCSVGGNLLGVYKRLPAWWCLNIFKPRT